VLLADDAIVGGHLALSNALNLILLDVLMPYMNGGGGGTDVPPEIVRC
jgi:hypothetical protein